MEINEETYKLFDRYFTDELSAEERVDFEKALSVDENFRNEFQWLSLAVSEIRMNGKSILRKQLAEIGAAIPASAFEKYSPSIKPKNFFKKWWWAIAIGVVTLAAAVIFIGLYFNPSPHGEREHRSEPGHDTAPPATDSFMKQEEKDSAAASSGDKFQSVDAAVFEDDESLFGECRSYSVRASSSQKGVFYDYSPDGKTLIMVDSAYTYGASVASSELILTVECCPQKSKPAFYSYVNRITLSATYADTSGLRFIQHGKDVMMTDGKPGYFILTKGAKEEPLTRISSVEKELGGVKSKPVKKPNAVPKVGASKK